MNNNGQSGLTKVFDVLVEVFNFIVIQYLLACSLISFKSSFLVVILFATNVFYITKHWECLKKYIDKQIWQYLIFIFSIVVVVIVLVYYGYFPISTTMEKGEF